MSENFHTDFTDYGLTDKRKKTRKYLMEAETEKRSEIRIFRESVFGSKEFRAEMKEKGIVGKGAHSGRSEKKVTVPIFFFHNK